MTRCCSRRRRRRGHGVRGHPLDDHGRSAHGHQHQPAPGRRLVGAAGAHLLARSQLRAGRHRPPRRRVAARGLARRVRRAGLPRRHGHARRGQGRPRQLRQPLDGPRRRRHGLDRLVRRRRRLRRRHLHAPAQPAHRRGRRPGRARTPERVDLQPGLAHQPRLPQRRGRLPRRLPGLRARRHAQDLQLGAGRDGADRGRIEHRQLRHGRRLPPRRPPLGGLVERLDEEHRLPPRQHQGRGRHGPARRAAGRHRRR